MIKISVSQSNVSKILNIINNNNLVIPNYQREFCWCDEKINNLIDSLNKNIPIGLFQFRNIGNNKNEVIDGLHRIRTIIKILTGDGIYYNFDKKSFTTDVNDYDYSKYIDKNNISQYLVFKDTKFSKNENIENSRIVFENYEKIYYTDIVVFIYDGTDDEIKQAFDRINLEGVSYTPEFVKVENEKIFKI